MGESSAKIEGLLSDNVMIMPLAFLYEVTKGTNDTRARIFKKFKKSGGYVLSPSLGGLLKYELSNHVPCGKPSGHVVAKDYSMDKCLKNPEFNLTEKQREALNREISFNKRYSNYITNQWGEYKGLLKSKSPNDIRNMIFNDPQHILEKYSEITIDYSETAEKPSNIDKSWLIFIWIQALSLLSLDMTIRYEKNVIKKDKVKEKIQHDLLDMEYLLISVLEGTTLYTKDNKLSEWRKLFD